MNIDILNSSITKPFFKSNKYNFNYKIIGDQENLNLDEVEKIYKILKNNNFENIGNYFFEFILIIEDTENIYIVNDNFGLIKRFYTVYENNYYFGSLWGVLKSTNDSKPLKLNYRNIFDQLAYHRSFKNESFVENVFSTNANQIITFNKNNKQTSYFYYQKFSYIEDQSLENVESKLHNFENSLKKQMSLIANNSKHDNFIMSLSGGLDSRIIIPYLKTISSNISAFHIGVRRGSLKTYDEYLVNHLLKDEKITFNLIDPLETPIEKKVKLDVLRNPRILSNILKAIDIRNYDVFNNNQTYISGGHGNIIGYFNDETILSLKTKAEFKQHIDNIFLPKDMNSINFNKLINNKLGNAEDEVDYLLNNFDNFNSFMEFSSMRNSNHGVFESLLGQLNYYSIYVPYAWINSQKWGFKNLKKRKVLIEEIKQLEKKYFKVPQQNSRNLSNNSQSRLLYQKINRKIRTSSVDYNIWWNNKLITDFINDNIYTDSIFYNFFDKNEIINIFRNKNWSQTKENILKLKILLEYLDEKKYLTENDEFELTNKY